MRGPPHCDAPQNDGDGTQTTEGRLAGVGRMTFAAAARLLFGNRIGPLPTVAGSSRPALGRWTTVTKNEAALAQWARIQAWRGRLKGALAGFDSAARDRTARICRPVSANVGECHEYITNSMR